MGALDDALRVERQKIDERNAQQRARAAQQAQEERDLTEAVAMFLQRAPQVPHLHLEGGGYVVQRGTRNRDWSIVGVKLCPDGTWLFDDTPCSTQDIAYERARYYNGTPIITLLARALLEPVT